MRDPEVIDLIKRTFLGIIIAIVFCGPMMVFFAKVAPADTEIYKMIKNDDSFVIFVEEKKCDKCADAKNILDSYNVSYFILSEKDKNYYDILNRFKLDVEMVKSPGLMFVENGELRSFIFDISDQNDIKDFVEINKLENTK